MLTINGIYTDIKESTYHYKVDDIIFYFSSKMYRDKFITKSESFYLEDKKKLELKFNTSVECKVIMLIKLYTLIEKRGFRIQIDGQEISSIPRLKIDYVI